MTQEERLEFLLHALIRELAEGPGDLPAGYEVRRRLLRGLMNVRPPDPIDPAVLSVQDAFLQAELAQRVLTEAALLPPVRRDSRVSLWRGDITALRVDAIVNAANRRLLGCFHPCHNCIDNVIHSAAGIQLRLACAALMGGREAFPGGAKLTEGYNLPARAVLHTIGPVVEGPLTECHRSLLASCYQSCLELADGQGFTSLAFCCISTGVYRFPRQTAAEIAVRTVLETLEHCASVRKVVFNVFLEEDYDVYHALLGERRTGSVPADVE